MRITGEQRAQVSFMVIDMPTQIARLNVANSPNSIAVSLALNGQLGDLVSRPSWLDRRSSSFTGRDSALIANSRFNAML